MFEADLLGRPPIMRPCRGYAEPERPSLRRELVGRNVRVTVAKHMGGSDPHARNNVTLRPMPWEGK